MGQTAEELRLEAADKRAELSRDLESIGDRMSPARIAERRKAMMTQRVSQVKERLMGVGETATTGTRHRMHDASESMHEGVHQMGARTQQMAQGSPLAMGLMAFGAGVVVSSLFPATQTERTMMASAEPTLQKVASETASMSRELVEEVKPAVTAATTAVKDRAQEAMATVKEA